MQSQALSISDEPGVLMSFAPAEGIDKNDGPVFFSWNTGRREINITLCGNSVGGFCQKNSGERTSKPSGQIQPRIEREAPEQLVGGIMDLLGHSIGDLVLSLARFAVGSRHRGSGL